MPPVPAQASNPIIRWEYLVDEWDQVQEALVQHLGLTVVSVLGGLVVSIGLAALVLRFRAAGAPVTAITSFLYTIPSVALFGVLEPVAPSSTVAAAIALITYTLLILVSAIVAGFRAVPEAVRDAADGIGLSPTRRVLGVELPLALPYIVTGLRVATVTTVGLVTVAAIIGQGGFGRLILNGLRREFYTPMTIGAAGSILLALLLDALLFGVGRLLTPWQRRHRRRTAPSPRPLRLPATGVPIPLEPTR
ncbi:MAG: ABC transporter permease subunit [Acidimicrobiales bacterium]